MLVLLAGIALRGAIYAPFPFTSFSNAASAIIMAYGVFRKQLFNPLKTLTEQLRTSEARWHGIWQNAVVGLSQVTEKGNFLMVNNKLAQILGYQSQEEFHANVDNINELVPKSRGSSTHNQNR